MFTTYLAGDFAAGQRKYPILRNQVMRLGTFASGA